MLSRRGATESWRACCSLQNLVGIAAPRRGGGRAARRHSLLQPTPIRTVAAAAATTIVVAAPPSPFRRREAMLAGSLKAGLDWVVQLLLSPFLVVFPSRRLCWLLLGQKRPRF